MRKCMSALAGTIVAASLLLTGCGQGTTTTQSSSSEETSGAIALTDQRGKSVELSGPADQIAFTVIPAPAILAAVDGSWDRIVGVNSSWSEAAAEGITPKIFDKANELKVIAGDDFVPNMEEILSLNPDVVVQWGDMGNDGVAPIESTGIPVVGLQYGTQEDLETWIDLFGTMVGKQDRAEEIINNMGKEAEELREKTAKFDTKPRVVQLSYSDSKLSVATKKDYAQHVFDLINAENVAADAVVDDAGISPEQLINWDPEVIFLSAFDTAVPEDLYNDPRFADVSAVKNKKVYRTPLGVYRWQVPCAESPLFWNWAAALVHPELEVDLPDMMREQISYLYNYDVTQEDIDLTLRTDINNGSANYDRVQ